MAFHERHERECPFCKARISATAPKCFNCGRFIREAEEDEDESEVSTPRGGQGLVWAAVAALVCVGLIVLLVRGCGD
jgi:hypothetical protein